MNDATPEFGSAPPGADVRLRPGGYVVLIDRGSIAALETPSGLVLPGGGQEPGESPDVAAVRETLEECGLRVAAGRRLGTADEVVFAEDEGVHYRKRCTFFVATLLGVEGTGEADHRLVWLSPADAAARLRHGSQRWAVSVAAGLSRPEEKSGGGCAIPKGASHWCGNTDPTGGPP